MRTIRNLIFLTLLAWPGVATGQSFELFGAAGPTMIDSGNSLAAGAGFSATQTLTIVASFERTHIASRTSPTKFRGGTLLLGTAELRFAPFGRRRWGPFALAGVAAGQSRPNVNEDFPNGVTNDVRGMLVGGGLHVPLNDRLAVFGDVRWILGADGNEEFVAVVPVRGGVAWRF